MPHFEGSQGRIFHNSWLPERDARSIVVVLHGYAEHLGLYDTLARRLVADGHAVHAMDAVGHGRSDGERAVIASWNYYIEDARRLVARAQEQHPGIPLVVIGHSGGAVAAYLLALRHPQLAAALVLSAGPLRPVPWAYDVLASESTETEDLDPTALLSTHPDYVHALLHDPLIYQGGFRRETVLAITQVWPEIEAGLATGRPDTPVLLVHGEADPVVPLPTRRNRAAARDAGDVPGRSARRAQRARPRLRARYDRQFPAQRRHRTPGQPRAGCLIRIRPCTVRHLLCEGPERSTSALP
jgi:alpha-beta hydrolase superfamily lysophospholipase